VLAYTQGEPPAEVVILDRALDGLLDAVNGLRNTLNTPPLRVATVADWLVRIGYMAMGLDGHGDQLEEAAREQAVAEHAERHAKQSGSPEGKVTS
jgi:hypothetical protein